MLSSIILSMAMSVSPAQATDVHNLDVQAIGEVRKRMRINNSNPLEVDVAGEVRKRMRIDSSNSLEVDVAGEVRKRMRI